MANKSRTRFYLVVGTALMLLAASSRASPQGEALRVRATPEEEQQQQQQQREGFEEELVQAAIYPPSSKDYSTQVWEGVIKQETAALEPPPSQDTDNETSTVAPTKKKKKNNKNNKKKIQRKKGTRKVARKGARKGRRHRHRRQKKKKVPIGNADAAQGGQMPKEKVLIPRPSTPALPSPPLMPIAQTDTSWRRPATTSDPLPPPPSQQTIQDSIPHRVRKPRTAVPKKVSAPVVLVIPMPTGNPEATPGVQPILPTFVPPYKPTAAAVISPPKIPTAVPAEKVATSQPPVWTMSVVVQPSKPTAPEVLAMPVESAELVPPCKATTAPGPIKGRTSHCDAKQRTGTWETR